FLLAAEPCESRQRPQVIFAEVQVRDLAVRRLEYLLDFRGGAQEIRVDTDTRRVELRHEVHEKPPAAVQAAVIANVINEPKNVCWTGHPPVFPQCHDRL